MSLCLALSLCLSLYTVGQGSVSRRRYSAAYSSECERLGIKGDSVESELRQLSSQLPAVFAEVGVLLGATNVVQARELYTDLVT